MFVVILMFQLLYNELFSTECLGINVTDCGSKGLLNYVNYTGCQDYSEEVCYIQRGSCGTLTVEFTPVEQVFALTVRVFGILGGLEMPLYVKNPDACLEPNITCPIPANFNQTYATEIEVQESLPKVSAEVKWQLEDQTSTSVICLQFPLQLI